MSRIRSGCGYASLHHLPQTPPFLLPVSESHGDWSMGVERETERSQAQKERTRLLNKQYKKPTNIKLHNHLIRTTWLEICMWLKRHLYFNFFVLKGDRLLCSLSWDSSFFTVLTAQYIVCILKWHCLGYLRILVHTTNYEF